MAICGLQNPDLIFQDPNEQKHLRSKPKVYPKVQLKIERIKLNEKP